MDFRTKVNIPKQKINISHKHQIMMMGSCFTENIGNELVNNKFNVNLNPFGILYNPQSILHSLERILSQERIKDSELFEAEGLFHSFLFHSRFSEQDKSTCLNQMNLSINKSAQDLSGANILIITFGTSFVYELKSTQTVVSNCHKLPNSLFSRWRLSVSQIVNSWSRLLFQIESINPNLQIIFTVSPIRHLRDGAHENQISKSVLLLSIDEICKQHACCTYFPAYEIVLDELRDYRFYADDMVHPSILAINYLWKCFSDSYFSNETQLINNEWLKIKAAFCHRPFNRTGKEYQQFLRQTLLKLKNFQDKYSYIYCNNEILELERSIQSLE